MTLGRSTARRGICTGHSIPDRRDCTARLCGCERRTSCQPIQPAKGCEWAWHCVDSQPLPMLDGGPCPHPNDRAIAFAFRMFRMSWRFYSSGNSAGRRRQMRDSAQGLNPFAVVKPTRLRLVRDEVKLMRRGRAYCALIGKRVFWHFFQRL
jgi:hypothetical protein